jgi:hypothetical protein
MINSAPQAEATIQTGGHAKGIRSAMGIAPRWKPTMRCSWGGVVLGLCVVGIACMLALARFLYTRKIFLRA